ncbi:PAS domain S-box protein [Roseomonas sp. OT10]|uniref:PAS domain S-box protein n=1 Tax=Roseomonas cutis TaxID=2897332 RepID=UPI001E5106FD|nr:PAS domain S-box protein [Roseomonas sp. OT10]UFN47327.1 PAS domain S-box protein [Roseomonas sp. OT10]
MTRRFLSAGGEMGALVRAYDWAANPLGPPETWPQPLRTVVGVMLGSRQPMFVAWGPQRIVLYNDGYAPMLGLRHPGALGRPFHEIWFDIIDEVGPILDRAYAGEGTHMDDIRFVMTRNGYPEETHFAFSYTPVRDEGGEVRGMFCACTETTQQVLDERDRVAQRERLTQMFEHAPGSMALLRGPQHVFELANAAYQHLVGTHRPVIGLPVAQVLPEVVGQGLIDMLDRVYATGEPFVGTAVQVVLQRHPEGPPEGRVLDFVWQPLRNAEGQVDGIFVEATDVTERRRAEEAMRESEERFRTIADQAPLMLWVTNAEGRCTFLNRAWYEFTGQREEEALGFGWLDATHPEDAQRAERAFRTAIADREGIWLEYRLRRADGAWRWAIDAAAPRFDGEGRFLGHVGSVVDITERKEAEQAQAQVNEMLERRVAERTRERDSMWRLSDDLMLVCDAAGSLLATNAAWSARLGWSEGELLRHRFLDLVHPEDRAAVGEGLARLGRGETARFEGRVRHRDGSHRAIAWAAAPEGERSYAIGRDVTDQRELEEQLRQSQKMEAIGQLTGGIAHDFNNMLTGIIGSLEMLKRRIEAGRLDQVDRYVAAAAASAQRAAGLTHRLLAFSRRQSLDVRATDVNRLVHGMQEILHRTLGENIRLQPALDARLWLAETDANQLESALLNLVINARDAMPHGGRVTISTRNLHWEAGERDHGSGNMAEALRPGDYVAIAVTDSGTGMTSDVVAKAFDPFFTTKPIGQGTGLGLSMIYGFVRQSGGQVRIESAPGHGTSVTLYLPRALRREAAAAAPRLHEVPRAVAGERVLVVEDDPAVRMLVLDVLEELGYAAIEAADGRSALPILEGGERIDLLVSDVGLPGLNGR